MCILKQIMYIISKSHHECFFWIFFQSIYQVDMKNIVKCVQDFFAYINALEINSDMYCILPMPKRAAGYTAMQPHQRKDQTVGL